MGKLNLKELNTVSKIALVLLVAAIGYFFILLITHSFFISQQTPMMQMMSSVKGGSIMNFSNTNSLVISLVPVIAALSLGLWISIYLFEKPNKDNIYSIMRRAMSEDEKMIMDEINKAGEITQDSLRFRLKWSKAKVSAILTNLDKLGLIQRERVGKTYKVYMQKKQKTV